MHLERFHQSVEVIDLTVVPCIELAVVQNQHLRGSDMASSESLDVRWANDDPNPKAIARVKRNYEEEYMNAVRHAVNELPPEQKRARLLEMQLYGNVQRGSAVAPYPGKLLLSTGSTNSTSLSKLLQRGTSSS